MRSKAFSYTIILALIGTLSLTGCNAFKKKSPSGGAGTEGGVPPLPQGTDIAGGSRPIVTGELPHGQFVPVYFDFDSAKIRPSEMSKLESVAAAMKGNDKKLVIEGYCDERGTAEYNRALGERRAQAAREELVHMGIDAGRISTISYGKDRPADPGHDESAWAKNRRDEFVLVAE
ncbi:MAG TPA: OmpA family protein [Verrucomicrobiae bacterium]|nr:OmpA family protein [Verrucomicrobiae bacterium]